MVEINNQRKAFLMLAWSRELITDVRKPETAASDVIVGGELLHRLLRSPSQTCHAKPKTQINRRRTLPASFPLVGCSLAALSWKTSLRKVRTLWHCSRLRSVALYLAIDRGDIRQAIDRCSNIWASLPALVMVSSSIRLTAWLQNSKKRRNGQRDWCMSRVTAIISALVICIIVCLSWAVNHYRDNAITYKAQRDKNARELRWRTRQLPTCRCVSVMLLRSMQNTRRS